ncbi:MBL fold metallo-hydrolase [Burkholderia lata]|uniref:MBL fold metallo-hydrolase n=1 Tax=Burkholderia lata (strain ATCC 17760 / DSM 23089 / LMG 22485 / NCIMB 9086 / R18194 / 383) TaxID=482957 RepID=UPI001582A301|nr:MBL fold metallo-hydrolase [Burkholderia lata]
MRLRFLGASGGRVTGSCTHFFYDRTQIQFLVDCGLTQGEGNDLAVNSRVFPFSASEIDFVFLTHAHQDHCGLIPRLYREGFSGKVICTKATAELARISLMDSAKHAKGLFTEQDVQQIRFRTIDDESEFGLSKMMRIDTDLFASFTRSAHILGAASITIGWRNDSDEKVYTTMSGDLGNNTKENSFQPLLAGRQGIYGNPGEIIVESTYGNRNRAANFSDHQHRMDKLTEIVKTEVYEKKSLLLIPTFSLHRTQEVLLDLYQILKRDFSAEIACQTHELPRELLKQLEANDWNWIVQRVIKAATEALPEDERVKIESAIQEENTKFGQRFHLRHDATIDTSFLLHLISERKQAYPVEIVLDSPLARKLSAVFGDELCRRQQNRPDETLYRNRNMTERLGLTNENEVDELLKTLFPPDDGEDKVITLGIHDIRYTKDFKTPRQSALLDRGCILITGAGMCGGGPVLQHLEKIVSRSLPASVLITGYMSKGTPGDALLRLGQARDSGEPLAEEKIDIGGEAIALNNFPANIIDVKGYYSGHADRDGLLDFIFKAVGKSETDVPQIPATVFINHGHDTARAGLKEAIEERSNRALPEDRAIGRVELPDASGRWYDLNAKKWLDHETESKTDSLIRELLQEQRRTNMLLQQLIDVRKTHANFGSTPKKHVKKG